MDLAERLRQRRTQQRSGSAKPTKAMSVALPDGWHSVDEYLWQRSVTIPDVSSIPARKYTPPIWSKDMTLPFVPPALFAPLNDMAFFDIETTGLSSGAGTTVMLAGLGVPHHNDLYITQWFAVDFPGEAALLQRLSEALQPVKHLVSYNGRSFDWPVVQSKALMSGIHLPQPVQVDLLHPARRLFRGQLLDCSLATIEDGVLGLHRQLDLPGRDVPLKYQEFLKTGRPAVLLPIFAHHLQDIHSLHALLGYLRNTVAESETLLPRHNAVGQAALIAAAGRDPQPFLQHAFEESPVVYDVLTVGRILVQRAKRQRSWHGALQLLNRIQQVAGLHRKWPAVERAKILEHRCKDYAAAVVALSGLPSEPDVEYRRQRLNRRLGAE